jgi:hypothetical protein
VGPGRQRAGVPAAARGHGLVPSSDGVCATRPTAGTAAAPWSCSHPPSTPRTDSPNLSAHTAVHASHLLHGDQSAARTRRSRTRFVCLPASSPGARLPRIARNLTSSASAPIGVLRQSAHSVRHRAMRPSKEDNSIAIGRSFTAVQRSVTSTPSRCTSRFRQITIQELRALSAHCNTLPLSNRHGVPPRRKARRIAKAGVCPNGPRNLLVARCTSLHLFARG